MSRQATSEAAREIQSQIDAEKGKAKKDYKLLKKLKSTLEAQLALDAQRKVLETELAAAEDSEDYDRCEELQARLEQVAVTVEVQLGAAEQVMEAAAACDDGGVGSGWRVKSGGGNDHGGANL